MNTPPPSDDERFDYIEENEINRSRQRRRIPPENPASTPAQQNRRARPQPGQPKEKRFDPNETVLETSRARLADTPYQTEEEPFPPRVRRASLPPQGQQRRAYTPPTRPGNTNTRSQTPQNEPDVPGYPQRQRTPQRRRPETEAPLTKSPYIDKGEPTSQLSPELAPMPPLSNVRAPASDQLSKRPTQSPSQSANRRPKAPGNAEETILDTPQKPRTSYVRPAPVPFEKEDEFEVQPPTPTGRTRTTRRPTPPPFQDSKDLETPRQPTTGRMRAAPRPVPPVEDQDEFEIPPPTSTGRMRATQQRPVQPTGSQPVARNTSTGRTRVPPGSVNEFQRRNTRLTTPPPPARHAYIREPDLASRWHKIRHNRPLLLLLGLLLLMLVFVPIFTSINHSAHNSQSQLPGSANQPSTDPNASATPSKPLDPHEIVITPPAGNHPTPPLHATAAYILDASTGATLYAKNPFMHLPILSTTKLMTALLTIEHGNLNQRIKITPAIWNDISQLSPDGTMYRVNNGSTYTLREMLYGLLMVSGNDCAVVIADDLAGSVPNFVKQMNDRAKSLGMNDTHYVNPHGLLDPGHYSSAHDLALVGRVALTNPTIRQISGTLKMTVPTNNDHPGRLMINGDQFLWWYPGVDSGKPGFDGASSHIQVISCTRNNRHLIGVVIGANNYYTDMRTLLNYGFDLYDWQSPAIVDQQHPIPFDYDDNYFSSDTRDSTIATSDGGRYYLLTGYSISGPFMTYFDKNGGLQKFGYPKSQATPVSDTLSKQSFEHGTLQCNAKTKQCNQV